MPRIFVAIPLPRVVSDALDSLIENQQGVRWLRPDARHLTLRFIGEVDDDKVDDVSSVLTRVQANAFAVSLKSVVVFPDRRRPRVIAVVAEAPACLSALHRSITSALAEAGIGRERRRYNPHVTIARLKYADMRWIEDLAHRHASFFSGPFQVEAFHLYRSDLLPGGAVYSDLLRCPLQTESTDDSRESDGG